MPKVSVLLPTFNRPAWLLESIESVLSQDVALELIVLDNGSDPETAQALSTVTDPRVIKLRQEVNNAENPWRLMGKYSTGEYIVFFTDDDRMLPGGLAAKRAVLDEHHEAGMVFSPVRSINTRGEDLGPSQIGRLGHDCALNEMIVACPVPMPAAMFRREYLGLISDDFNLFLDWALWLEITSRSVCKYLDQDTVQLRLHAGSDTETHGVRGGAFAEWYPKVWKHWLARGVKPNRDGLSDMLILYLHFATTAGKGMEESIESFQNEIERLVA